MSMSKPVKMQALNGYPVRAISPGTALLRQVVACGGYDWKKAVIVASVKYAATIENHDTHVEIAALTDSHFVACPMWGHILQWVVTVRRRWMLRNRSPTSSRSSPYNSQNAFAKSSGDSPPWWGLTDWLWDGRWVMTCPAFPSPSPQSTLWTWQLTMCCTAACVRCVGQQQPIYEMEVRLQLPLIIYALTNQNTKIRVRKRAYRDAVADA